MLKGKSFKKASTTSKSTKLTTSQIKLKPKQKHPLTTSPTTTSLRYQTTTTTSNNHVDQDKPNILHDPAVASRLPPQLQTSNYKDPLLNRSHHTTSTTPITSSTMTTKPIVNTPHFGTTGQNLQTGHKNQLYDNFELDKYGSDASFHIEENLYDVNQYQLQQNIVKKPMQQLQPLINILLPPDSPLDEHSYLRMRKMAKLNPDLIAMNENKINARLQELSKLVLHPTFYNEYTSRHVFRKHNIPPQPPQDSILTPEMVSYQTKKQRDLLQGINNPDQILEQKHRNYKKLHQKPYHPLVLHVFEKFPLAIRRKHLDSIPQVIQSIFSTLQDDINNANNNGIYFSDQLQSQSNNMNDFNDDMNDRPGMLNFHDDDNNNDNDNTNMNRVKQDINNKQGFEQSTTTTPKKSSSSTTLDTDVDPYVILGRFPKLLELDLSNRINDKIHSLSQIFCSFLAQDDPTHNNIYTRDDLSKAQQIVLNLIVSQPDILQSNVYNIIPKRLNFIQKSCLFQSATETIDFVLAHPRLLSPTLSPSNIQRLSLLRLKPPRFNPNYDLDKFKSLGYETSFAIDMMTKISQLTPYPQLSKIPKLPSLNKHQQKQQKHQQQQHKSNIAQQLTQEEFDHMMNSTHNNESISIQDYNEQESLYENYDMCWGDYLDQISEEQLSTSSHSTQRAVDATMHQSKQFKHDMILTLVLMHTKTFNFLFPEYVQARKRAQNINQRQLSSPTQYNKFLDEDQQIISQTQMRKQQQEQRLDDALSQQQQENNNNNNNNDDMNGIVEEYDYEFGDIEQNHHDDDDESSIPTSSSTTKPKPKQIKKPLQYTPNEQIKHRILARTGPYVGPVTTEGLVEGVSIGWAQKIVEKPGVLDEFGNVIEKGDMDPENVLVADKDGHKQPLLDDITLGTYRHKVYETNPEVIRDDEEQDINIEYYANDDDEIHNKNIHKGDMLQHEHDIQQIMTEVGLNHINDEQYMKAQRESTTHQAATRDYIGNVDISNFDAQTLEKFKHAQDKVSSRDKAREKLHRFKGKGVQFYGDLQPEDAQFLAEQDNFGQFGVTMTREQNQKLLHTLSQRDLQRRQEQQLIDDENEAINNNTNMGYGKTITTPIQPTELETQQIKYVHKHKLQKETIRQQRRSALNEEDDLKQEIEFYSPDVDTAMKIGENVRRTEQDIIKQGQKRILKGPVSADILVTSPTTPKLDLQAQEEANIDTTIALKTGAFAAATTTNKKKGGKTASKQQEIDNEMFAQISHIDDENEVVLYGVDVDELMAGDYGPGPMTGVTPKPLMNSKQQIINAEKIVESREQLHQINDTVKEAAAAPKKRGRPRKTPPLGDFEQKWTGSSRGGKAVM